MEQFQAQIAVIADELQTLRGEVIAVKGSHASLHQSSVEANSRHAERLGAIEEKVERLGQGVHAATGKGRALMEPKQVTVPKFAGSVADSRSKFLTWTESMKDKVELYEGKVVEAMERAAHMETPITAEMSIEMGMSATDSRQLQGLLKEYTEGTAQSIVRNTRSGVGLESWRMLYSEFNPKTLQNTINSQHNELHPKGASKVSDLPARLLDWERSLRRCADKKTDSTDQRSETPCLIKNVAAETTRKYTGNG